MLKDQKSVSQNFNCTSRIVNFNKRNNPQVDGFTRKKNFEAPSVVSKRGDIFKQAKNNKNALKPTLYINNSTKRSTGADLANTRPSFRKSNPVKYYSDFTIISAIENATRSGKYHLDVNSIDRLKDYLKNYDPSKDPDKVVDNIPDINPTPKIVPYTPHIDIPVPTIAPPQEISDDDPPVLPTQSKWKSRLWTAAKWAAVLAAAGITYKLAKDSRGRAAHLAQQLEIQDMIDNEFGVGLDDGGPLPYIPRPVISVPPPLSEAEIRNLFPEDFRPSVPPPPSEADLRLLFPEEREELEELERKLELKHDDFFETGDYASPLPPSHHKNLSPPTDDDQLSRIMGVDTELEQKRGQYASPDASEMKSNISSNSVRRSLFGEMADELNADDELQRVINVNRGNRWSDPDYVVRADLRDAIKLEILQDQKLDEKEKAMLLSEFCNEKTTRKKLMTFTNSSGQNIFKLLVDKLTPNRNPKKLPKNAPKKPPKKPKKK